MLSPKEKIFLNILSLPIVYEFMLTELITRPKRSAFNFCQT